MKYILVSFPYQSIPSCSKNNSPKKGSFNNETPSTSYLSSSIQPIMKGPVALGSLSRMGSLI